MKSAGIFIALLAVTQAGCGTDAKQEARHELQRAASALKQGSPQAAIAHLDTSLAKGPSAEAYQLRAEAQLDPSRFRRALEDAVAGLKLDPDNRQLREVRDLAAACLKLVQGEASIVEQSRYLSEQRSANCRRAPAEQLSFGDAAQQKRELRDLVERNPFWRKSTRVQREAYIQDLLETEREFIPLILSREQHRLAKDEVMDRDSREQCDFEMLVTFGPMCPLSGVGFGIDDVSQDGHLLLSGEQRLAILQDALESGMNMQELTALARQMTVRESWESYQQSGVYMFVDTSHARVGVDNGKCPCCNQNVKERGELMPQNEPLERRLSADIWLGKFERQSRIYNLFIHKMGASR
jgi:hypothetical protein